TAAACKSDWLYMHATWAWRLYLRFCPLLPRGKRAGISVSGVDNCNLFGCPAFRPGSHRRISGADAFPLNETASVRRSHDNLACFECLRSPLQIWRWMMWIGYKILLPCLCTPVWAALAAGLNHAGEMKLESC